jgi:hypothetical protein
MCHNDTWPIALDEFAARSQTLLMGLRGLSKDRKGCQAEVDYLLDTVPLNQTVSLVDADGDHALVQKMILERWEFLSPDSPNLHDPAPCVHIYLSSTSDKADVQGIPDLLMQAAQAGSQASRPARPRSIGYSAGVTSLWRFVVLCVLVLALPLQGLAAGWADAAPAMTGTGSGEPVMLMAHGAHDDGQGACHEAESSACSVCSACCLVAAPPGGVPELRHAPPVSAPQTSSAPAPRSALTTRLERPPRPTSR